MNVCGAVTVMAETNPEPEQSIRAAADWLETPFGQALLAHELRLVEAVFDGMFGEHMLQLFGACMHFML